MLKVGIVSLSILVALWFLPITHDLLVWADTSVFKLLNHSLSWGPNWQAFWGALNLPIENKIGLLFAVLVHLLVIYKTEPAKRMSVAIMLFFFWTCFEVFYAIKGTLFDKILGIKRLSPSLVFPEDTVRLSEVLNNPKIKDASSDSFPGGHALFNIYWGLLSWKIMPKPYKYYALTAAVFMCTPRVFSGAHWLSDVVYTGAIALVFIGLVDLAYRNIGFFKKYRTS